MNHRPTERWLEATGDWLALRGQPTPATYWLHDAAGRPIGTITAPIEQPTVGPHAPTFYLRREGTAESIQ
jgi:hypothetical protein